MRWYFYPLVFAYCAFLFWLSSMPQPPEPDITIPGKDKIAHIVLYGILTTIVSIGMHLNKTPHPSRRHFWLPILFASLYGLTDELHQAYIPMRNFDPLDLVADTFGAFVAQWVLFRKLWKLPR